MSNFRAILNELEEVRNLEIEYEVWCETTEGRAALRKQAEEERAKKNAVTIENANRVYNSYIERGESVEVAEERKQLFLERNLV